MFEIAPVEVDVPTELAALDEVESIMNELVIGESLRERGMFRLWRMKKGQTYLEIVDENDDNGYPLFGVFEDFVKYFCQVIDVSRAKIFDRIRTYSQLEWLEFSHQEMLNMMSIRPGLYSRALKKIFNWDAQENVPTSLKTDYFGDPSDPDEAKEGIKEYIEELSLHDSVSGAIETLEKDVLGQPEVYIFFLDGSLVVRFDEGFVTEGGMEITEDVGEVIFEAEAELPLWVTDEIERRYKIKARGT